ncbi:hypothetical protein HYS49_01225 [Candidatus Woesearchaeota archaeon]|nr:hypothetical protein [Candidatus Woesearchaeota archaeon]
MRGDKQGSLAVQLLIIVVVIILSSIVVLLLVRAGILLPQATDEPILNTEFLPVGRGGELVVREFAFCEHVDRDFQCFILTARFVPGDDVSVRFLVESGVYNGMIRLVRNYQLKDPLGEVVISLDAKNSYSFDGTSAKEKETIAFADTFTTDNTFQEGTYTLDIFVENPLLNKQLTISKKIVLIRQEADVHEN